MKAKPLIAGGAVEDRSAGREGRPRRLPDRSRPHARLAAHQPQRHNQPLGCVLCESSPDVVGSKPARRVLRHGPIPRRRRREGKPLEIAPLNAVANKDPLL